MSAEACMEAERVRLARHREPHKCPREDSSSACDFNRYGRAPLDRDAQSEDLLAALAERRIYSRGDLEAWEAQR